MSQRSSQLPKLRLRPYSMATVVKSAADAREYRTITLPNKLTVLLASDPVTEKSSAALDVGVGHFSDPEEVAGLAHFCEHMLFLGTEKFPDEAEYNQYLNQHGGMSNAYTSMENTNYYFDVQQGRHRAGEQQECSTLHWISGLH